jgi:RsiW-degrading membrane proteinase PrsW (M82 family)
MFFLFVILGLLPSFAWLIFFLKEDSHPEPKKMIARVFVMGALMAFVAVALQFLLKEIFHSNQINEYQPFSLFCFSLIEEIVKFLAAYSIIRKNKFFDEPIDAMIYIITAALGFAMAENIAIVFNTIELDQIFTVITLRFVGATLLHALSSGLVGYYWACSLAKINGQLSIVKGRLLIFGIILATLLHTFFNYLILISKEAFIYPIIFLIIIALFIFWDFERIKTQTNAD